MNPLLQLVIQEMPSIINMIKDRNSQINPSLPPLTDAEALTILQQALDSSLAKDDNWLAVHPKDSRN